MPDPEVTFRLLITSIPTHEKIRNFVIGKPLNEQLMSELKNFLYNLSLQGEIYNWDIKCINEYGSQKIIINYSDVFFDIDGRKFTLTLDV